MGDLQSLELIALGICSQLPWNLFITASGYFHSRFAQQKDYGNDDVTLRYFGEELLPDLDPLEVDILMQAKQESKGASDYMFQALFAIVFNLSTLFANFILVGVQHRISDGLLVNGSLVIIIGAVSLTAYLTGDNELEAAAFSKLTYLCLVVVGVFGASFTIGICRVAAKIGDGRSLSMISTGQGCSGLIASVLQTATLVLSRSAPEPGGLRKVGASNQESPLSITPTLDHLEKAAVYYFICGAIFLVLNFVVFKDLARRIHRSAGSGDAVTITNAEEGGETEAFLADTSEPLREKENEESRLSRPRLKAREVSMGTFRNIFNRVNYPIQSLFLIFWVTLAVFPALTSTTHAASFYSKGHQSDFFVPVLFLSYNFFSVVGRLIASIDRFVLTSSQAVFWCCLSRVVFIPLFWNLNIESSIPGMLKEDVFPIVLNGLLGFTTGHLTSNAFVLIPKDMKYSRKRFSDVGISVEAPSNSKGSEMLTESEIFGRHKAALDLATTLSLFSYSAGLLSGSCTSLLLMSLLRS